MLEKNRLATEWYEFKKYRTYTAPHPPRQKEVWDNLMFLSYGAKHCFVLNIVKVLQNIQLTLCFCMYINFILSNKINCT